MNNTILFIVAAVLVVIIFSVQFWCFYKKHIKWKELEKRLTSLKHLHKTQSLTRIRAITLMKLYIENDPILDVDTKRTLFSLWVTAQKKAVSMNDEE